MIRFSSPLLLKIISINVVTSWTKYPKSYTVLKSPLNTCTYHSQVLVTVSKITNISQLYKSILLAPMFVFVLENIRTWGKPPILLCDNMTITHVGITPGLLQLEMQQYVTNNLALVAHGLFLWTLKRRSFQFTFWRLTKTYVVCNCLDQCCLGFDGRMDKQTHSQ